MAVVTPPVDGSPAASGLTAHAYFSPRTTDYGPRSAVVAIIDAAKHEVQVGAYAFASVPIGDALLRAHLRGVKVRIVADAGQAKNDVRNQAVRLKSFGVPVRYWGQPDTGVLLHLKLVMVDGGYRRLGRLSLGSSNLTSGGDSINAEITVVLSGTNLADVLRKQVMTQLDALWTAGRDTP